jgi:hypothetical protein
MTPDKIKEGFEAWAKFLEDDFAGYIYSEQAWQACAEWMLSQASTESDEELARQISRAQLACFVGDEFTRDSMRYVSLVTAKAAIQTARLSSAKEIASLKDQILRYEQDNRELRDKGIKEIAEKDALVNDILQVLSSTPKNQDRIYIGDKPSWMPSGWYSPHEFGEIIRAKLANKKEST